MATTNTARRSNRRAISADLNDQAKTLGRDAQQLVMSAREAALGPVQEFVRERPVQALLIAAGIGAVFAMYMRR